MIVLESGGCPFKEHLYELEEEQEISGQILFVLFVDSNGSWRVLTVGVKDKMVTKFIFLTYSGDLNAVSI